MAKNLSLAFREMLPPIVADELDQLLIRLNAQTSTTNTDVTAELSALTAQISGLSASVASLTIGVELTAHKGQPSGYAGLTPDALVPVSQGGTNSGTALNNGRVIISSANALVENVAGTSVQVLYGDLNWGNAALTKVDDTNVTLTLGGAPTTALITAASLTLGWTGTLAATRGGTGFGSYAVGDLLYASTATVLAKLADVATGNALISGGVNIAPSWGKIGLTTHVSDTLPIANGGTNATSQTTNGVNYFDGTRVTSGVALAFDGSKILTLTAAANNVDVHLVGTASAGEPAALLDLDDTTTGTSWHLENGRTASLLTFFSGAVRASLSTAGVFTTTEIHATELDLGVATSVKGILKMSGNTSGTVTLQSAAAAGTWALTWPTTGGTSGYVLTTDGTGISTWTNLAGVSVTSITGTANQVIASASVGAVTLSLPQSIATTSSPTFAALTLTAPLTVGNGGTGTATAFTVGSVVFAGASGVYAQDNANFFWDASNHRLGILTASPAYPFELLRTTGAQYAAHIANSAAAGSSFGLFIDAGGNSSDTAFLVRERTGTTTNFIVRGDGRVAIGTPSPDATFQVLGANTAGATPQMRIGESLSFYGTIGYTQSAATTFALDNAYTGSSSSAITFGFGGSVVATILQGGQFGVGMVPSAVLDITGNVSIKQTADSITKGLRVVRSSNDTALFIYFDSGNDAHQIDGTYSSTGAYKPINFLTSGAVALAITTAGNVEAFGGLTKYKAIATAGWGVPAIYGSGRATGQTAAVTSVATYTVGAADGSFLISANVNVTAGTIFIFTVTCAYTDETGAAQTLTLSFSNTAGGIGSTIQFGGALGTGVSEGIPLHIRAKASTAITIATTGTFTTVTYNVEGTIAQLK